MAFRPRNLHPQFDYHQPSHFKGILATAPSGPQEGWMYINSGNNTLYIYYSSTWNSLHVLAASHLLLETGDTVLLETGDKLVLE